MTKTMRLNYQKSKIMIFNFTQNYQFSTRLQMDKKNLDIVEECKLLGTIVTSDLKWDKNIQHIVRRANARMQLMHKIVKFAPSREDLKNIYILFVRSILEQSAVVWHSSLTLENSKDLERVQKSAVRLIIGKPMGYRRSLDILGLEPLFLR